MEIKHLAINKHDDAIYPITWIKENIRTCKIDRDYKDHIEPVLSKAIFVKLPCSGSWAGYAANDEGWMYICDATGHGIDALPEVSIEEGILEVEENVNNCLKAYSL